MTFKNELRRVLVGYQPHGEGLGWWILFTMVGMYHVIRSGIRRMV